MSKRKRNRLDNKKVPDENAKKICEKIFIGEIMRKLALDDEILLNIEKPARYIGGEVNSVMKDKDQVDIRFAMCFPDVTE